jgi:hypothetical protein
MRVSTTRRSWGHVITTAIVVWSAACNSRSPIRETEVSPTAPTATVITPVGPVPVRTLFAVDVTPKAMVGGGMARGVATLTHPAPAGGMNLELATSDPVVTVPSSITVPAGAETVEFPVTGQAVSADRQVAITATGAGASVSTTLSLWAAVPAPPTFWFISEPGDTIGGGDARRYGADSAFTASCSASRVTIDVRNATDRWTAQFTAPLGAPLRVGAYENAAPPSPNPLSSSRTGPELGVSRNGLTCFTRGQFVVHEVDLTQNGMVRAFWASFQQQCSGRPQVLRGDVRVVNPPGTGSESVCYNGSPLPLPTPTQPTFLRFASTLGDYIGGGQTRLFEPSPLTRIGGDMRLDNNLLFLTIRISGPVSFTTWDLSMGAPSGRPLTPGVYKNARRSAERGSGDPTLSLSGESRGCNVSIGEFEVMEAVYGPPAADRSASGTIQRFRATFSQTCDSSFGGLSGDVSLVSIPPRCTVIGVC